MKINFNTGSPFQAKLQVSHFHVLPSCSAWPAELTPTSADSSCTLRWCRLRLACTFLLSSCRSTNTIEGFLLLSCKIYIFSFPLFFFFKTIYALRFPILSGVGRIGIINGGGINIYSSEQGSRVPVDIISLERSHPCVLRTCS